MESLEKTEYDKGWRDSRKHTKGVLLNVLNDLEKQNYGWCKDIIENYLELSKYTTEKETEK